MEITFYLNEKFFSKFQIFWAIAEKVNFIILNYIKHAGSALRLKLQSRNNFYSFYRLELKLCRMVELCILNNRMFFVAWILSDYFESFSPLSNVWIDWPFLMPSSDVTTREPGIDFDWLIV